MKANELRIGNWINKAKGLKEWDSQVNGHDIGDFEYSCKTFRTVLYNSWIPIPLTIEWLKKFGFHRMNNAWVIKGSDFSLWQPNDDDDITLNSDPIMTWIKYVHQLQNVFFALTEEELKIQ